MKRLRLAILAAAAAFSLLAWAQQSMPSATSALRVVAPANGAQVRNTFVTVKYELAERASAAGTPTFRLQLDGRDPVQTTDLEYTFTGLTAGSHTIAIQLVDANDTPVRGASTQVQFTVLPPKPGGSAIRPGSRKTTVAQLRAVYETAVWQGLPAGAAGASPARENVGAPELPRTGSPLPLLSVIGMGVLVGGIASALRTRHSNSR